VVTEAQLFELVERVFSLTKAGAIQWTNLQPPRTYGWVSRSGVAVVLRSVSAEEEFPIALIVFDKAGEEQWTVQSDGGTPWANRVRELWMAVREAQADDPVLNLLRDLRELPPY
jgi:hypothetical protein